MTNRQSEVLQSVDHPIPPIPSLPLPPSQEDPHPYNHKSSPQYKINVLQISDSRYMHADYQSIHSGYSMNSNTIKRDEESINEGKRIDNRGGMNRFKTVHLEASRLSHLSGEDNIQGEDTDRRQDYHRSHTKVEDMINSSRLDANNYGGNNRNDMSICFDGIDTYQQFYERIGSKMKSIKVGRKGVNTSLHLEDLQTPRQNQKAAQQKVIKMRMSMQSESPRVMPSSPIPMPVGSSRILPAQTIFPVRENPKQEAEEAEEVRGRERSLELILKESLSTPEGSLHLFGGSPSPTDVKNCNPSGKLADRHEILGDNGQRDFRKFSFSGNARMPEPIWSKDISKRGSKAVVSTEQLRNLDSSSLLLPRQQTLEGTPFRPIHLNKITSCGLNFHSSVGSPIYKDSERGLSSSGLLQPGQLNVPAAANSFSSGPLPPASIHKSYMNC